MQCAVSQNFVPAIARLVGWLAGWGTWFVVVRTRTSNAPSIVRHGSVLFLNIRGKDVWLYCVDLFPEAYHIEVFFVDLVFKFIL